jgi:hypothetical protein
MTSIAQYVCCCNTTTVTPVEVQICHTCNQCRSYVIDWSYDDQDYVWPNLPECFTGYWIVCDPDGIPDTSDEYDYFVYDKRPACPELGADCGCSCSLVVTPQSWCTDGACGIPPEIHGEVKESTLQSLCWTLPYVSTATENTSGIWSFNDAGNIFLTGYTTSITRFVESYSGSIELAKQTLTSPVNECHYCAIAEHDSTNTTSPTVEYRYGGTYVSDIPAMVIGGATAAQALWTCEITATDCIIRNDLGVTQYTFALSTNTIEQLRVALDATTELVSVRQGPSFSSATFRNVSSTYLPIQGPFPIGHYSAGTWDTINIRHAGDAVEDWQIRLASSSYTIKNNVGVAQGRVYFQQFSANYGLWEQGFQINRTVVETPCIMASECCDCGYNPAILDPFGQMGCDVTNPTTTCEFALCPSGTGCDDVCPVISPFWAGGLTNSGWQSSSQTDPVSESLTESTCSGSFFRINQYLCWTANFCLSPQIGDISKCFIGYTSCTSVKQDGFWLKRIVSVT